MSMTDLRLLTDRLELLPLTADALDALILRDRRRLEAITSACFPNPLVPPPLMEDALPLMRDRLREDAGSLGWWAWLMITRETREAVGSGGFVGKPDSEGIVVLGYAVYPAFERQGYATEATQALVSWVLDQTSVTRVRATIPPGHVTSLRVAKKVGMRQVGTAQDAEVGDVLVLEMQQSP